MSTRREEIVFTVLFVISLLDPSFFSFSICFQAPYTVFQTSQHSLIPYFGIVMLPVLVSLLLNSVMHADN